MYIVPPLQTTYIGERMHLEEKPLKEAQMEG
jgi:hypothetical protein